MAGLGTAVTFLACNQGICSDQPTHLSEVLVWCDTRSGPLGDLS